MYILKTYITQSGRNLFQDWLTSLRDPVGRRAIVARRSRVANGHFGDHKPVGHGVHELRIPTGSGYRIYYARDGDVVILLLTGGDKSTQSTDIQAAIRYFMEWKTR